jgi:hypothetical protein
MGEMFFNIKKSKRADHVTAADSFVFYLEDVTILSL